MAGSNRDICGYISVPGQPVGLLEQIFYIKQIFVASGPCRDRMFLFCFVFFQICSSRCCSTDNWGELNQRCSLNLWGLMSWFGIFISKRYHDFSYGKSKRGVFFRQIFSLVSIPLNFYSSIFFLVNVLIEHCIVSENSQACSNQFDLGKGFIKFLVFLVNYSC